MNDYLPDSIRLSKTIPYHVGSGGLGGENGFDRDGRRIVQLSLHDDAGDRMLNLLEGDEFEFAGATWKVAKVYEPTTSPRGAVAELVRVTRPEA